MYGCRGVQYKILLTFLHVQIFFHKIKTKESVNFCQTKQNKTQKCLKCSFCGVLKTLAHFINECVGSSFNKCSWAPPLSISKTLEQGNRTLCSVSLWAREEATVPQRCMWCPGMYKRLRIKRHCLENQGSFCIYAELWLIHRRFPDKH